MGETPGGGKGAELSWGSHQDRALSAGGGDTRVGGQDGLCRGESPGSGGGRLGTIGGWSVRGCAGTGCGAWGETPRAKENGLSHPRGRVGGPWAGGRPSKHSTSWSTCFSGTTARPRCLPTGSQSQAALSDQPSAIDLFDSVHHFMTMSPHS